jgi:hypothetical protein
MLQAAGRLANAAAPGSVAHCHTGKVMRYLRWGLLVVMVLAPAAASDRQAER